MLFVYYFSKYAVSKSVLKVIQLHIRFHLYECSCSVVLIFSRYYLIIKIFLIDVNNSDFLNMQKIDFYLRKKDFFYEKKIKNVNFDFLRIFNWCQ